MTGSTEGSPSFRPMDHPSTARRDWVAIAIALLAVIVSAAALLLPIAQEDTEQETAIESFLEGIVQPAVRSVMTADNETEPGSEASDYVYLISKVWEAWEYAEGVATEEAGSWQAQGDGYEVCFPKIALLSSDCQHFARFKFEQDTANIKRFSIDTIPVGNLIDTEWSSISTDEKMEPQVDIAGVLTDPSFSTKTVIMWTVLRHGYKRSLGSTYGLTSMQAQNEKEEWLEDPEFRFQRRIGRYEAVYGGVRTEAQTNLIYSCWKFRPKTHESCVWLNLSL